MKIIWNVLDVPFHVYQLDSVGILKCGAMIFYVELIAAKRCLSPMVENFMVPFVHSWANTNLDLKFCGSRGLWVWNSKVCWENAHHLSPSIINHFNIDSASLFVYCLSAWKIHSLSHLEANPRHGHGT